MPNNKPHRAVPTTEDSIDVFLALIMSRPTPDEWYLAAARCDRVGFRQAAEELTELRGIDYTTKQCQRIWERLRARMNAYLAIEDAA